MRCGCISPFSCSPRHTRNNPGHLLGGQRVHRASTSPAIAMNKARNTFSPARSSRTYRSLRPLYKFYPVAGFSSTKIKTRLEFFEKLILQMNLMVKWGLGGGACGNVGSGKRGGIGWGGLLHFRDREIIEVTDRYW
jgi:hypothetical protein